MNEEKRKDKKVLSEYFNFKKILKEIFSCYILSCMFVMILSFVVDGLENYTKGEFIAQQIHLTFYVFGIFLFFWLITKSINIYTLFVMKDLNIPLDFKKVKWGNVVSSLLLLFSFSCMVVILTSLFIEVNALEEMMSNTYVVSQLYHCVVLFLVCTVLFSYVCIFSKKGLHKFYTFEKKEIKKDTMGALLLTTTCITIVILSKTIIDYNLNGGYLNITRLLGNTIYGIIVGSVVSLLITAAKGKTIVEIED